jgi:1-acyl-sn-glycerol-3-phosphate acyltransferase
VVQAESRKLRARGFVTGRSIVFNALFGLQVIAVALVTAPVILFCPRHWVLAIARAWAWSSLFLLRTVVGLEVEVRGREHIPQGGALIAAKHQSELETFALMPYLPDAVYVLKRELTWIPFFGWFLLRLRMIAIDRSAGGDALTQMLEQGEGAVRDGRQIVIFPEGTRRPVGSEPKYKSGIYHLYERLRLPCTPVAMDTGVFWPRDTFRRRQGISVIQFLEPIPPGLPRPVFERTLRERIEAASAALAAEALNLPSPGPEDARRDV